MERNPYTLLFGKQPLSFLPREAQRSMIVEEFSDEIINEQAYVIVGLRGSGKTVFMTDVARAFEKDEDWIVVDLNAERNLLEDFVSSLNSRRKLAEWFRSAKINLSFLGFGVEIHGVEPVTNLEVAAEMMLRSLADRKKRVLVTVDEITNSPPIREFTLAFQSFIRAELPIFFLSTGLYENIRKLESYKGSTFFMRTPKIEMRPLHLRDIADQYEATFSIPRESAVEMAKLTNGYSFAFQVLGHYTWKEQGDFQKAIPAYKRHLFNYSYEKIWEELSQQDRVFAVGIAKSTSGRISEIQQEIGWEANKISPYRQRLHRRGLLDLDEYGVVKFKLPFFGEFALGNTYEY